MSALWFSRVRLLEAPSVHALVSLVKGGSSPGGGHRLVWSLFAGDPDRPRDFLYRESEPGRFYILSRRPPEDHHALFQIDTKAFEADLAPGDRIGFSLRANPVVQRRRKSGGDNGAVRDKPRPSAKDDVVMHALHALANANRAEMRSAVAWQAGHAWLLARAERCGFAIEADADTAHQTLRIDGYRQHRLPRGRGAPPIRFSTLDFDGELTVVDPAHFIATVAGGIGGARAFGCGLFLIRRV